MASNFLAVPSKTAHSVPNSSQQLLQYISQHFRDAHPEAFKQDVQTLVNMRRDFVEPKAETHPEIVKGLMRYNAQLAFIVTKFPSDMGIAFSYNLPFPPPYSITPDTPISLPSITFERASVLFNIAAVYASLATQERRAEIEGIKRALGYLSSSAGVLNHLIMTILPTLKSEVSSPQAAGYDMTESFLTTIREFVLAEAQECFWQQAKLQGSYKNTIIAKLSMKVSDYYKSSLAASTGMDIPSQSYFPDSWINHIAIKQLHFEAAAQFRMSQEDLDKGRYGDEIARLRVAEGLAKKGLAIGQRGIADSVLSELKNLQAAVKSGLERAVRENDLVYMSPIPPASQLAPIAGISMVKIQTPPEIAEPISWLMGPNSGMVPLFSALVPYGVHLALSIYDDRKDTLIRDLDSKREELDGLAASTMQSLNLPGSLQALEKPVGLPPSLLKKAEEVDAAGGADKIRGLLMEVNRLAKSNAKLLSEAMDILDQEAHETEQLIERQPQLAETRPPSHIANQQLIGMAGQYDATIKQAASSDATVRGKWEEWRNMIEILSGGEDIIADHVPSTTSTGAGFTPLPSSVRPLRASVEELDDRIANRAALVTEARHIAEHDDVRGDVLQEASRLASGGTGDVRPEAFEGIFEKAISKYDKIRDDMDAEPAAQDQLLEQIRTQNDAFLAERKTDPRVKEREQRLQDMDMAYWKWREIVDNIDQGIKFYTSLGDMLHQFKDQCSQFLNSRRVDIGQLSSQFQNVTFAEPPAPSPPLAQQTYSPPAQHYSNPTSPFAAPQTLPHSSPSPPAAAPAPSFSLPHPNSSAWQASDAFLPPPPPPPILRSGGVQTQPRVAPAPPAPAVDSPRRVTRSAARQAPIGDPDRNPYKKGSRGGGEGVI
ncbi:pH-response regulator protein palA/RIM20 [Vanrija pseudolonga]|uniref:PH-response regulator protein palA/RIM20 n=1 Tax=Vanrija pseudolonga TaxID=143232 RepID=A0AAF0Y641_9TREE|nr:pH-response regulator protein palA/RIM20 [Vanrija pseudolonga]